MDTCNIFVSVTDKEDKVANLSRGYRVVRTKVWLGHFVEHLVCNQRKKKLAPTPHTQSSKIWWAKGWAYI